jgi:hypothetical protein
MMVEGTRPCEFKVMALAMLIVMVTACGAARRDTQPSNQEPGPPLVLIRRAENALAESLKLDFRRPFLSPPYNPSELRDLYFAACVNGDRRSCWIAETIAGASAPAALHELIRNNCLAGDLMSCRGLPVTREGSDLDGTPGEKGRSRECMDSYGEGCDPQDLRRECEAGFAQSCYRLMLLFPSPEWQALRTRTALLARDGCKAGIGNECSVLGRVPDISEEDHQLVAEQLCTYVRRCVFLFRRHERDGDRVKAAAIYERACQYEDEPWWSCLWLAEKYLAGEFPEPVPGRGQALVEWVCSRNFMVRRNETCKLARTTSHLGQWKELPR